MRQDNDTAIQGNRAMLAGKYMTFRLASEEYGLSILKVRELIGLLEITRIPRAPAHVRGVINLRGKIIPVVDLRLKFEMAATDPTSQTVIIVVQLAGAGGGLTMGILVDEVLEVRAIGQDDIEPPPNLEAPLAASFIMGVGKADKRVVFLLDIDRVLAHEERASLSALSNPAALDA
jgi:purine-binding chemotaxis protein CheW